VIANPLKVNIQLSRATYYEYLIQIYTCEEFRYQIRCPKLGVQNYESPRWDLVYKIRCPAVYNKSAIFGWVVPS
jgi:hypothetical protein